MKMMTSVWRRFVGVLCLLQASALLSSADNDAELANCIAGISRITSYDVAFRIDNLAFPNWSHPEQNENSSDVFGSETNRDVLAIGMGRRIERGLGGETHRSIAVINWKDAVARKLPLGKALTYLLPGWTYYDYLNPRVGDFLLTELLRDQRSKVAALEPQSLVFRQRGFQVENPAANVNNVIHTNGYIRVWPDPDHGYRVGKIEWYQPFNDGRIVLFSRMEVEEFVQIQNVGWVPAKATFCSIAADAPSVGRARSGVAMVIDATRCSWNSVRSDKLFLARSLPKVDEEAFGWKYYYSPLLLKAMSPPSRVTQSIVVGIVFAVMLCLPWIVRFIRHRTKSTP